METVNSHAAESASSSFTRLLSNDRELGDNNQVSGQAAIPANGSSSSQRVLINVSGQQFITTVDTISKHPQSRLGRLLANPDTTQYSLFFEADAKAFRHILNFYISGKLHIPKGICSSEFLSNLEFWGIGRDQISTCCSQDLIEEEEILQQLAFFDRRVPHPSESDSSRCRHLRYYVWAFLTDPNGPHTRFRVGSKLWAIFYLLMTFFNGMCYALETVPSFWTLNSSFNKSMVNNTEDFETFKSDYTHKKLIDSCDEYIVWNHSKGLQVLVYIDGVMTGFFAVEIWFRFFCCPDWKFFWRKIHGLDMLISVVECISYVSFLYVTFIYIPTAGQQVEDPHSYCLAAHYAKVISLIVGEARLLRLLSYASIYSGLKVMMISLYRSWREILLLIVLVLIAILLFGPIAYYTSATKDYDDDLITSIPLAYWFVLVTMTTVGYGDVYPSTLAGYLATAIIMIAGLMITALPIAIVGGNFATVYACDQKLKKQKEEEQSQESITSSTINSPGSSDKMVKMDVKKVQSEYTLYTTST